MTDRTDIEILCTGDVHLGRQPARVDPEDDRLAPAAVWDRIVDQAIDRDVDAVALTGDVVDRDNRYFEARGPLERGLQRLAEAAVPVVAVSGNHDYDVLPDLVDDIGRDSFRLLGQGGDWEDFVLEVDGTPAVRFVGWSYPDRHVRRSPLDDLDAPDDDLPTVGLLHTEIDRPASRYAPVDSTRLAAPSLDAWLLGHVHRPHRPDAPCPVLYPGSPQPLDPTETGAHGPWLVDLDASGSTTFRQLDVATLHYRELEIDLTDVDDRTEFRSRVTDRIRGDLTATAEQTEMLRRLVYRVRYTGRTGLHRRLHELSDRLIEDLQLSFGDVEATVDAVRRETGPCIDLDQLAGTADPPAVLAQLLLEVRQTPADRLAQRHPDLLKAIDSKLDDVHRSGAYDPLNTDPATATAPDEQWVRDQIMTRGLALLDEMLEQNGPP